MPDIQMMTSRKWCVFRTWSAAAFLAVSTGQRADDHEMLGIGVDEVEMRGAMDCAQAATVFAVAAMEAEHAHDRRAPVGRERKANRASCGGQAGRCKTRA